MLMIFISVLLVSTHPFLKDLVYHFGRPSSRAHTRSDVGNIFILFVDDIKENTKMRPRKQRESKREREREKVKKKKQWEKMIFALMKRTVIVHHL